MLDLQPPLRAVVAKVTAACDRAGVGYAIIDAVALAAYGISRNTKDAAFIVEFRPDNPEGVQRLVQELSVEGFRLDTMEAFDADLKRDSTIMCAHLGTVRADFLFARPHYSALQHRRQVVYQGQLLWFASPEDVVALKLVAGRATDLVDVDDLLAMQADRLDRPRLRAMVADFAVKGGDAGLVDRLERALAELDARS